MPSKHQTGNSPLGASKSSGEQSLHDAMLRTGDELAQRSPLYGTTISSQQLPGGRVQRSKIPLSLRQGGKGSHTPHAFWGYVFRDAADEDKLKVKFQAGFLKDYNVNGLFPFFTDDADRTRELTAGDTFFAKIVVDAAGITTAASFEVFNGSEPFDSPYVSASGDVSESGGEYYVKVVEFADAGEGKLDIKYFQTNSLEWCGWSFDNVGDGARVGKDFNAETNGEFRLRTLIAEEESGGGNVTITIQELDDEIKFSANYTGSTEPKYWNGSSYIHVDNGTDTIELANSNTANFSPKEGETGFFEYFCAVAGEVGHTLLYGTEPHALGSEGAEHEFAEATDHSSQQTSGGTS